MLALLYQTHDNDRNEVTEKVNVFMTLSTFESKADIQ